MTNIGERQSNLSVASPSTTVVGLALAGLIVLSWLAVHIAAILLIDWNSANSWFLAPVLIALQTWLSVGLFIIAHDAMHGTLAPGWPRLNRFVGQLSVLIYAGFSYSKLYDSHHAHHRHVGSADDPDFDEEHPTQFWPWYVNFFRHYFGWKEVTTLTGFVIVYAWILGGRFPVLLTFWALPAILSSIQLFYFGTFRPHNHINTPFVDKHNARSENFSWFVSLLTCFHFGYHHEHHDKPWVPWWRLPSQRKATISK